MGAAAQSPAYAHTRDITSRTGYTAPPGSAAIHLVDSKRISRMTTPASSAALSEIRVIASAILDLGRSSTPAEIAKASGLPQNVVIRRLRSSMLVTSGLAPRRFVHDRNSNTWGLTAAGLAEVKEHKPPERA